MISNCKHSFTIVLCSRDDDATPICHLLTLHLLDAAVISRRVFGCWVLRLVVSETRGDEPRVLICTIVCVLFI